MLISKSDIIAIDNLFFLDLDFFSKYIFFFSKLQLGIAIFAILQLSNWEYHKIALCVANLRNFQTVFEIWKSSVVGAISAILQLSNWEYHKIAQCVANLRNFQTVFEIWKSSIVGAISTCNFAIIKLRISKNCTMRCYICAILNLEILRSGCY